MNDKRRASAQPSKPLSSSSSPMTSSSCKTAKPRWKWVEDYCWSHECHRSKNQCNDKWNNLLRRYESRPVQPKERPSYWQVEKHERKDRNPPSNLSVEVFQALHEVAVVGGFFINRKEDDGSTDVFFLLGRRKKATAMVRGHRNGIALVGSPE